MDAISNYKKARELDFETGDLRSALVLSAELSSLYREMGQADLSMSDWENVKHILIVEPKLTDIIRDYELRSVLRAATIDTSQDEGQKWLKEVEMRFGKESTTYQKQAGVLFYRTGNYHKAIDILEQIISEKDQIIRGEGLGERYYLALAFAAEKDFRKAVDYCRQVLQLRRVSLQLAEPIFYYKSLALLSELYERVGEVQAAMDCCQKLLTFWQLADAELPLLLEVENRLERLKQRQTVSTMQ